MLLLMLWKSGRLQHGVKQRKDSRMRLVFSLGALSSSGKGAGRREGRRDGDMEAKHSAVPAIEPKSEETS